jgi:hypothetical protein
MKERLDKDSSQNYPADIERGLELSSAPGGRSKRMHHWTMTHSHFALMGGFAFEKTASGVNILPNDRPSATLTSHALRMLATHEPDIIPDISVETIESKSKADLGARVWVMLQCGYFIFKFSARRSEHLPISILELTTLIQVVYCLIFFAAWSSKPLDVTVPHFIQVDTDLKRQVCAWMVMQSTLGTDVLMKNNSKNTRARLIHVGDTLSADNERHPTRISGTNQEMDRTEEVNLSQSVLRKNTATNEEGTTKICTGEIFHGFKLDPQFYKKNKQGYIFLSKSDTECIRLASSLRERSQTAHEWKFSRRKDIGKKEMLVTHISALSLPETREVDQLHDGNKLPNDNQLPDGKRLSNGIQRYFQNIGPKCVRLCGILVAGSLFASGHLLALNAPFPTQTQGMLWLASCIVAVSPLGFALLLVALYCLYLFLFKKLDCSLFQSLRKSRDSEMGLTLCNGVDIVGILFILMLLAYVMLLVGCRVYLLVSCILNLTHLPAEVYQKPKLMQWLL